MWKRPVTLTRLAELQHLPKRKSINQLLPQKDFYLRLFLCLPFPLPHLTKVKVPIVLCFMPKGLRGERQIANGYETPYLHQLPHFTSSPLLLSTRMLFYLFVYRGTQ